MKQSLREAGLLWVGVLTALAISAYRLCVGLEIYPAVAAPQGTSYPLIEWATNACIFLSLLVFLATWVEWRLAQKRRGELESVVASVAPDVLLVVEPNRTIRLCNPAVVDMFGYQVEDVIGAKTGKLYFDRRSPHENRPIHDTLQKIGFHVGTARGRRSNGTILPLEIVTGKLKGRSGAVVLIRDTTERMRLEEMRADLTHMIVHDLKSPLASIGLAVATVKRLARNRLEERELAHLALAESTNLRLADMILSLLDVTRLEDGKMPLLAEINDVTGVVKQAAMPFAHEAELRNTSLVLPSAPARAWCDPEVIRRVVANLLGNALKFTPEGGAVRITSVEGARHVEVSVVDEGPGIPAELQDKIFERFAQVEVRKYSTGLGLTFCKLAVEAHGGQIGVVSEEGKGSAFWFTLPRGPQA